MVWILRSPRLNSYGEQAWLDKAAAPDQRSAHCITRRLTVPKYLARVERVLLYEIIIEADDCSSAWREAEKTCLAGLKGIESGYEVFDVEEVKEELSRDE